MAKKKNLKPMGETVDDIIRMAIEDVFPDHVVPDADNFLPDGTQYKAPDHAILGGKVFIERKSRNAVDNSQYYYKLEEIAKAQGRPFFGFGLLNLGNIIKTLPDPDEANRQMVDFMLNQLMKSIRDARRKFEEHSRHIAEAGQLRILILADNSEISGANATEEHFLGRKMGGYDKAKDETGLIDAIIYLKHPKFVWDREDSYWFKCLIKGHLSPTDRDTISRIAAALHQRIAHHASFYPEVIKIRAGRFRPLVV